MVIDCETCIMKQQFVLDAIKVGDLVQSEVQVDIYVSSTSLNKLHKLFDFDEYTKY